MSISSMAMRTAMRGLQDDRQDSKAQVVVGLKPASGAEPVGAEPLRSGSNPVARLLQDLTAWIPSESIATFLAFGGVFSVYDDTAHELALVGVVAVLTTLYAYRATKKARTTRTVKATKSAPARTAAVAVVAFIVWWLASPGSWLTADNNVSSFWVALGLLVFVSALPEIARRLRVEPLN